MCENMKFTGRKKMLSILSADSRIKAELPDIDKKFKGLNTRPAFMKPQ